MSAENASGDHCNSSWFLQPQDLFAVHQTIWQRLVLATTDRMSGWRLPVLATASSGDSWRQRIVVLRQVQADQRRLSAHTDVRSAKVAALKRKPDATWLFYDHQQQVQLQVNGTVSLHTDDDIANNLWDAETETSLRGYLAPMSPGTPCQLAESNLPVDMQDRIPSREELLAARKNFAVICCQVHSLEWLMLQRSGNLRASFRYSDADSEHDCEATWLAS